MVFALLLTVATLAQAPAPPMNGRVTVVATARIVSGAVLRLDRATPKSDDSSAKIDARKKVIEFQ